jgi:hypothetical protein
MCVLINVRICSGSAPAASSVWTLTVDLTGATLGRHWRGAGWAPAAMLAYEGRKPYNRMANSEVYMPTYLGPYPSLRL